MKYLTRFCSLFCCLVLLFTCFSVPANAETLTNKPYHVFIEAQWGCWVNGQGGQELKWTPFVAWHGDGTLSKDGGTWELPAGASSVTLTKWYTFANDDNTIFLLSGDTAKITIENIKEYFAIDGFHLYTPHSAVVTVKYTDGTETTFTPELTRTGEKYNIQFSFTAEKDVSQFIFRTVHDTGLQLGLFGPWSAVWGEIGEQSDHDLALRIDVEEKEIGLLTGISNAITNGFKSVGNWFGELGGKITDVFNAIQNLPAKIWEFIENGLKSLFVPDEEYMVSYKDKWDRLLADRLGAVYQVVQITFGAWENIGTADKTDTINIPVVTIPLLDGQEFSFGGYDVKIVPDGFEYLVTALKSIVGIVCTIMFINGLRKRYDEIMGVEQ